MASGLLIILINKATKLSDGLMGLSKEYIADIKFGIETDTMDIEGSIIRNNRIGELDRNRIKKILKGFTGKLEQVPPMYSALKHGGQPLYRLARQGIEVFRKARKINIYGIQVLEWKKDGITVKIACSSGTYIRVLAHDIGKDYGTGAALSGLRRTRIGSMGVDRAAPIDSIAGLADIEKYLSRPGWMISLEELVKGSISLYISREYEEQVKNGSRLSRSMLADCLAERERPGENKGLMDDMAAIRSDSGKLMAIHRILTDYDKINTLDLNQFFTKSIVIL